MIDLNSALAKYSLTVLRKITVISSKNDIKDRKTTAIITEVLKITANEQGFMDYLVKQGINTIIRKNEQDRLYGITFIDHNTKNVFNGSHLGKQFSANIFHEIFSKTSSKETVEPKQVSPTNKETSKTFTIKQDLHPLFDFMTNTSNLIGESGLLEFLLIGSLAENPEEQQFAYQMKKKKKDRN